MRSNNGRICDQPGRFGFLLCLFPVFDGSPVNTGKVKTITISTNALFWSSCFLSRERNPINASRK